VLHRLVEFTIESGLIVALRLNDATGQTREVTTTNTRVQFCTIKVENPSIT